MIKTIDPVGVENLTLILGCACRFRQASETQHNTGTLDVSDVASYSNWRPDALWRRFIWQTEAIRQFVLWMEAYKTVCLQSCSTLSLISKYYDFILLIFPLWH